PQTICRESRWLVLLSLGLCRGIGGRIGRSLGLGDGREGLHIEFLVVPIPRHDTGLDSFHEQEAHSNVSLHVGRQPHFVIHKRLLENEAGALLKIRQQAAADFHVAGEIGFQPRHVVRLLVHPNDSGEFLHYFFNQFVGLEFRIRLEIENQHVLPAKTLPPRIHKLARAQEYLNPRLIFFLALPFFLGLLFFRLFLGGALLVFLDTLLRLLVFLFLFCVAQRLAVFFHQRSDLIPVEIEKRVLVDFVLFCAPVTFEFRF